MSFHALILIKFAAAALTICLSLAAIRHEGMRVVAWIAVVITALPMLLAGWVEWTEWKPLLRGDTTFGPLGGFLWLFAVAALIASKRPRSLRHD